MITRALSIHQPWASMIAWGIKRIENRDWRPRSMLGERIAVHATKQIEEHSIDRVLELDWSLRPWIDRMRTVGWPTGAIIGTARITGWCETVNEVALFDLEQVKWFVGRYGIKLEEARNISLRIPCSGMPGFWPLGEAVQQQLAERLAA